MLLEDYDPARLEPLLGLLNAKSKREAQRQANELVIARDDLTALVMLAQAGGFSPYKYANHFDQRVPGHLQPKASELQADLAPGPLRGEGAKLFRKLFQTFEERRLFAAHLLYTPDYTWWHLLYFDQRDVDRVRNHWERGPHLHYASESFHPAPLEEIWDRVRQGDTAFLKPVHVRFDFLGGEEGT